MYTYISDRKFIYLVTRFATQFYLKIMRYFLEDVWKAVKTCIT